MRPIKIHIDLDDPDIFKEFSADMNSFKSDIDARYGSVHLDAKSLLAIVALGKPEFYVTLLSDDTEEIARFCEVVRKYSI